MANKMIKALKKSKGVQIFIGSNTNFFKNTNLSMILSNYKTKNGLTGAIGVIGPKRIDYQRIVPIVSYMSETISKKQKDYNGRRKRTQRSNSVRRGNIR